MSREPGCNPIVLVLAAGAIFWATAAFVLAVWRFGFEGLLQVLTGWP